jgi:hypothetical protein
VGAIEGSNVGRVGAVLGSKVGRVGAALGSNVGCVGAEEGSIVGLLCTAAEGSRVGPVESSIHVGAFVGS